MTHRHHAIANPARIPFGHQAIRSVFQVYDPLNTPNEETLAPHVRSLMKDFMAGDKKDDIHEFWGQDQFTTDCIRQIRDNIGYTRSPISDGTYKRITPALRLATIMIQRNMDFWLQIIYATEKFDYVRMDRWLDEANFVIKDYHRMEFTTVDLLKMKRMTLIGYDRAGLPNEFGITTPIWAASPNQPPRLKFGIGCNASVWDPFTSTTTVWNKIPHEEKCRAWVHLAVTLVHEFAHVLQMYRDRDKLRQKAQETHTSPDCLLEPRVSLLDKAELGLAFEIRTFGGIMDMPEEQHAWRKCSRPTIFNYDSMLDIPQILTPGPSGRFTESADISPGTIVEFMQESTWANNRPLEIYLWQHR